MKTIQLTQEEFDALPIHQFAPTRRMNGYAWKRQNLDTQLWERLQFNDSEYQHDIIIQPIEVISS